MKKLIPQIILLFYDYPQVFIGKNEVDTLFICMVTSETDSGQIYTCTPISIARKNQLVSGLLDLRTVFSKPEVPEFYQATTCTDANDSMPEFMLLTPLTYTVMPIDLLPADGLYFNGFDEVALKAAELYMTVSYASHGVPAAHANARIKSTPLEYLKEIIITCIKSQDLLENQSKDKVILDILAKEAREMRYYISAAEGFLQLIEKADEAIERKELQHLIKDAERVGNIIIACLKKIKKWQELTDDEQSLIIAFSNIFNADTDVRTPMASRDLF